MPMQRCVIIIVDSDIKLTLFHIHCICILYVMILLLLLLQSCMYICIDVFLCIISYAHFHVCIIAYYQLSVITMCAGSI